MVGKLLEEILRKASVRNGMDVVYIDELPVNPAVEPDYYKKEGIFFKTPSSKIYQMFAVDISEEYMLLKDLYAADPDHTAKPYAFVLGKNESAQNGSLTKEGYLLEYIDGRELLDYISAPKSARCNSDKEIIKQLEAAVSAYHSHRLVHGDLYMRNIMIDPENHVKIIDPLPEEQSKNIYEKTRNDIDVSRLKYLKARIRSRTTTKDHN